MSVHHQGPAEGRGPDCPETMVNGHLKGACLNVDAFCADDGCGTLMVVTGAGHQCAVHDWYEVCTEDTCGYYAAEEGRVLRPAHWEPPMPQARRPCQTLGRTRVAKRSIRRCRDKGSHPSRRRDEGQNMSDDLQTRDYYLALAVVAAAVVVWLMASFTPMPWSPVGEVETQPAHSTPMAQ